MATTGIGRIGWLLAGAALLLGERAALAGCGDVGCGRTDWTEVTLEAGQPKEAKLHGGFAWEASPDGWASHPIGGTRVGFLHLACASGDAQCRSDLDALVQL